MKSLSNNKLFIISLTLPIILLLSMTVKPLITIYFGETVKLQTVPFDPRDLFYGDYVDLDFEAENIPINIVENSLRKTLDNNTSGSYSRDDLKVYVVLEQNNITGVHDVISVSAKKPKSGTYIKGISSPYIHENKLTVSIPIEKYYLAENTGTQLEEASSKGQLIATIKVYNGYSILRSVE
ncbi:GDYXXLXY domain-containing protein [Paenisporosarcina sp. TG20]|uniref:GDYXXLXY domain-containing protein n=1 Tax=Paenisporosarcina sp. TG20 TaxID=1211706 RepID=UPI0002E025E9|nr:GDYXXLXY domain-containing protein [Paenisporosarcina sp. TG20]